MKVNKKVRIRHRLPMEVVQLLRTKHGVLKSKKTYNRKNKKKVILSEVE